MAKYPFTYNLNNPDHPQWTSRSSSEAYAGRNVNWAPVGITAGLIGSGFIPTGKNKNLWHPYTQGLRYAEEYSPGGILRTFNLSSFFSQFKSRAPTHIKFPAQMDLDQRAELDYLTDLIGKTTGQRSVRGRLLDEGVTLKGRRLLWGKGGVALPWAGMISSSQEIDVKRLQTAYSVGIGSKYAAHRQIIGGRNIFQHAGRQASMWGTELVGRFNRLLEAPFEIEPFQSIFGGAQRGIGNLSEKILGKGKRWTPTLAVKHGTGTQMLGRLAGKWGLGLTAAMLGYQTVDWAMGQSSLFDPTIFAEGLTHGLATAGVEANILASKAAEVTGLHSYREAQEEIAPGSTSLSKLLAFPIMGAAGGGLTSYIWKVGKMASLQYSEGMTPSLARQTAEEQLESFLGKGPLATAARNITSRTGFYARQDWIGNLFKKIATPKDDVLSFKLLGKLGPTKLSMLAGAGLGLAGIFPFLAGALTPSTRPDELEAIYSGEQEVPIRKGRWWEFGRSPYEGSRIMYHRPHWYAKQRMHARERGIWGDAAEKSSPLTRWFQQEFTYKLEKERYYDRPYPITGLPFEDIPLIGPVLANTIGRLIKPPRLMHEEEWKRGDAVAAPPAKFGQKFAGGQGQLAPAQPISPYDIRGTIGEQAYRFTEMIGLPGFISTSLKESLTGSQDLFDQYSQLESARRMYGTERAYWDAEVGGGLGTTEALRRLYPHRRRQIDLYNPIRNTMPEWLPGPGERGPDLLHGDPYVRLQEGELRLPGKGYEARFPELEGVAPEDYPTIHKYRILADVGQYTNKFDKISAETRAARAKGWSEYEENIYQTVAMQQKAKRQSTNQFSEYQYLSSTGGLGGDTYYSAKDDSTGILATLNEMKKAKASRDEPSTFSKIFGGYWEAISHGAETPFDQLTPFSPAAKLVHQRTAIESYERTQLYGTESAFWNKPYTNFLRPFAHLVGQSLGSDHIPDFIEEKRDLQEYFDVLKYVKNTRLANMAREQKDFESARGFEQLKDETLFGVNPFTYNFSSIYRALPSKERSYYQAFADASTTEERAKILDLVPENEKALYIARWKQKYVQDLQAAEKAGLLSDGQIEEADRQVKEYREELRTEGLPSDKELWEEYIATRMPREGYADWYRRTKLLPEYTLPGPDWVGWHPQVDLDDIKLKTVQELGEDMHDYGLWRDRAQSLAQKPFLNEEAIEPILNPEELNEEEKRARIDRLLRGAGIRGTIKSAPTLGNDSTRIVFAHNRD